MISRPVAAATGTVPATRRRATAPKHWLIGALLVYLGLAFTVRDVAEAGRLPVITIPLLAACAVAFLGWRSLALTEPLRWYLAAAAAFSSFVVLSAVNSWDDAAVLWAVKVGMWSVFLVPGLALVLRDADNRRIFIFAIGMGQALYGALRALWFITGTDLATQNVILGAEGDIHWFLDANRNDLDIRSLFVLPLLWLGSKEKPVWFRRTLSLFIVLWLMTSGGRSGLAILPLMAIGYILLVPGLAARFRAGSALAFVGVLVAAVISLGQLPTEISVGRVGDTLAGRATDERRALLNARAWNLGWDNPFFGHGYGRILGTDDEALDAASSSALRRSVQESSVHNRYLWIFASVGPPAALAFLAMLATVLVALFMARRSPDARLAMIALIGILLLLWFHTGHQELTDYPLALALGVAIATYERRSSVSPPLAERRG